MGRAALEDARQYTSEVISQRWTDLFERLREARSG
jgi:hypothetical protein